MRKRAGKEIDQLEHFAKAVARLCRGLVPLRGGLIMSRRRERDDREMTGANTTPLAWVEMDEEMDEKNKSLMYSSQCGHTINNSIWIISAMIGERSLKTSQLEDWACSIPPILPLVKQTGKVWQDGITSTETGSVKVSANLTLGKANSYEAVRYQKSPLLELNWYRW